jgi:[acyl-carrier-protein] S-malonyltransferase
MGFEESFNRSPPTLATSARRNHGAVTSEVGVGRQGGLDSLCAMSIAVVFPGQGSQFVGMADPWIGHPAGKAVFEEASDAMGRDLVAGTRDEAALATTELAQPALLACGVAAFRVLRAEGLGGVVGAAGHSLGEFSALVAAGVLPLVEGLRVVVVRGEAMQRAGEARPGAMSALLGASPDDAEALCHDARGDDVLIVANRNSPVQSVISGSVAAIERAEALAAERRIRAVRLNVAGAFHSPLMEPAVRPILDALDEVELADPAFPIAENVSGTLVSDASELRELLARQVISPVRWQEDAASLSSAGATTFLECGPGDVLTKLAKRVVPGAAATAVGSPDAAMAAVSSAP